MSAWERVDVVDAHVGDDPTLPDVVTLADGRRLVVPGEPPQEDMPEAASRRFDLARAFGRPPAHAAFGTAKAPRGVRVMIDGDRLVAVAHRHLWHPLDMAIAGALGHDTDAALAAFAVDPLWWHGRRPDVRLPSDFHVGMGGRLGCSVEIGADILYDGLEVVIRREMPEQVVASMEGRQLRDVVGDPRLAEIDAPIARASMAPSPFAAANDRTMRVTLGIGDDSGWREIG